MAMFILYSTLGLASLAALGATVVIMLANVPPGKLQEKFQEKLMDSKDGRMKATSEILHNMRILKLQGWEMRFLSKIIELRKTETNWLKRYLYTSATVTFVFWGTPTFVAVLTFGACVLMGIPLESGKVLSALATFRVLQEPIYVLPETLSMVIQTKVSLDRIASFLCLEELPSDAVQKMPSGSSEFAIDISNGCFSWEASPEVPTLKDLNIKVRPDLEILPFGDQTVIGERGINLSGGQKQRIQIARALYQDTDIYLFDDPFSAVDAHTGSHLFKECLLGDLASKTVVYVTHQIEFLPSADLILVMKDGRIAQAGKYDEILGSEEEFMELVGAHKDALTTLDAINAMNRGNMSSSCSGTAKLKLSRSLSSSEKKDKANEDEGNAPQSGQLVQEEEREKGRVGFWVYWNYLILAYRGALVPFVLLAQILFQVLQIASNYWMAWAAPVSKDVEPAVSMSTLLYVYVALALGSSLCILASTDQSEVDTNIAGQMGSVAFSVIQLVGIVAVMSQVAWQVFAVFIPVFAVCVWYQRYYIDTARELQRLVGVCKAPIMQHFAESITGSTTIRSFGKENQFVATNGHLTDAYSQPKFYSTGAREWLCFRLDALSSLIFAFSLIFLINLPTGLIDPGIAGLAITYGLNLNMLQASVVWGLCTLENKIISVERILQYISIPAEPPLFMSGDKLDHNWPSNGEIQLYNLHVKYAPQLPFVLKGLTVTFPGGMKTGIVGRTGSGKSTLIQALFRIVDPTIGQILIDDVDICTIGLHDLRSRLSIIPQEPTMFEGTVRSNLDPLGEYTDNQIWELGDEVRKKELKLDSLGVAIERDTPTKLLEDRSSLFSKLVSEYTMRSMHT
ncbi:hypothetical protein C2845_PM01G11420 [Panicum miliaceum]|uniref:ABC transporter C family member 3-like n=1 Tax=Panicum miliaceum TaxID=4540 RepID=A0A3L6TT18_PANMI|nr:hypothetical protein C2845_PM01G11420 [Panicum miliaceum]